MPFVGMFSGTVKYKMININDIFIEIWNIWKRDLKQWIKL